MLNYNQFDPIDEDIDQDAPTMSDSDMGAVSGLAGEDDTVGTEGSPEGEGGSSGGTGYEESNYIQQKLLSII